MREKFYTKNEAFRKRGNRKRRLCVLVWTKNILKTELFKNDDFTIPRLRHPGLNNEIQNPVSESSEYRDLKRLRWWEDKGKVKYAYEPSDPSGRSLSRVLQHEATTSISTPPGMGC